ncbi:MAG: glycosyltransferase [Flavobacterium sp.]|nr:glycosyltransferase [Flavobacterium sp.]
MRVGLNPHKDQPLAEAVFTHQVIIPVHIPNQEGYFTDSLRIVQKCLDSLFSTSHSATFITVVNNGSDSITANYLTQLWQEGHIHELIQTTAIGKVNALLKGLVGHRQALVTLADSDVLFLPGWQQATQEVFLSFPKAGVVGIVPQYRLFLQHCSNVLFDLFTSKQLRFFSVQDPVSMEKFHQSIGWGPSNPAHGQYTLCVKSVSGITAYVGAGHFVATYKRALFDSIQSFTEYRMGGTSETYLDELAWRKNTWRLTTYANYAYHMGNAFEPWMDEIDYSGKQAVLPAISVKPLPSATSFSLFLKHKLFKHILKNQLIKAWFYRFKGLPKTHASTY